MEPSDPDPRSAEGLPPTDGPRETGSAYWRLDPEVGKPREAGQESARGGTPGSAGAEPGSAEAIGPYRLVRPLGQGGMGIVYLAEQKRPIAREVALKLIKRGMDTREVVARFESERQALALMTHPCIARVLDGGSTADGRPYFVMEHVPGAPITEYCEAHHLSVRQRVELLARVADAVQHAHQKGIIHRDLKPSNILVMEVDRAPLPKVIDFGIAKALGERLTEATLATEAGRILGTPDYMSPEQADLIGAEVDTRTDIYSLGAVLYEVLTGYLPIDLSEERQHGILAVLQAIREKPPLRPSTRWSAGARQAPPGSPILGGARRRRCASAVGRARGGPHRVPRVEQLKGDLDWIALKALEKDPARRYASASELAEDLRRHLRNEPVLAGPPSGLYRLRKLFLRNRDRVVAGAVAGLIIIGALVSFWVTGTLRTREAVSGFWSAISRRDAVLASDLLAVVAESDPGLPEAQGMRAAREQLEADLAVERSRGILARARAPATRFREMLDQRDILADLELDAGAALEPWTPEWERDDEVRAQKQLKELLESMNHDFSEALRLLDQALRAAPPGSDAEKDVRQEIEDLHWARRQEAVRQGGVVLDAAFFEQQVEAQGLGSHAKEIEGQGELTIVTRPPGARLSVFRYVEEDLRLVPRPFDPRRELEHPGSGVVGTLFLRVERVWEPRLSPLLEGDRIVSVGEREVHTRHDLADALSGVGRNERVVLKALRKGAEASLDWTPFADGPLYSEGGPLRPGRLLDIKTQLGVTFEGYPLERLAEAVLGPAPQGDPLRVQLPRGSYLLVLQLDGRVETRLPVSIPRDAGPIEVGLRSSEEVPEGFVVVPSGEFSFGGDEAAYEALPRGRKLVPEFFLARREVTFEEYVAYLNDLARSGLLDAEGKAPLRAGWSDPELSPLAPPGDSFNAVPGGARAAYVRRDAATGLWQSDPDLVESRWPVVGTSMVAAVEYAHWRTLRGDGKIRFRLPRDLEWEKAARGADERLYVWGNYLFPTFCRWVEGVPPFRRRGYPEEVLAYPMDESPYGIRDMAGSASEPILGRALRTVRSHVFRGGNWDATDRRDLRATTRNRGLPETARRYVGIRLAADPAP